MPRTRLARPRSRPAPAAAEVVELRPQSVPAVAKAVAVIRMINARAASGATLSEISDTLKITRSHCYNILRTLADHGWIIYDAPRRLYRLGAALAADSTAALVSHPHLPVVRPVIDRLADEIGLPCTVCEPLVDGPFLVVHTAHYPDPSVSAAPVGYRFPPTAAPQFKAKLAWLTARQRDELLAGWRPVRHTRTTIVERDELERDLAASRRRGWVRSSGEFVEGFTTLALPIFDRGGDVVLLVSAAARSGVIEEREGDIAGQLARAVNVVHGEIDGRPPIDFPRP
jgi:DNA-binding IclR family transcriptional regulator